MCVHTVFWVAALAQLPAKACAPWQLRTASKVPRKHTPHVQGYAVNVPLQDGLDDDMFLENLFVPVIAEVMQRFDPSVIVLQSGADSVASDKIGKFNLSTCGHASAGRWLREKYPNIPVMVLGGGGYTISNVARTWSYETIAMLNYQDKDIPYLCPLVRPRPALCDRAVTFCL